MSVVNVLYTLIVCRIRSSSSVGSPCLHRESCCAHLIAVDAILIDMVQVHIAHMRGPGTRPDLREGRAKRLECFIPTT